MKSIRKTILCIAFAVSSGTLGFFAWQDYQLRHDEFYKLGALYKARFPKVGKYVVDELKKGDDESLMALASCWFLMTRQRRRKLLLRALVNFSWILISTEKGKKPLHLSLDSSQLQV